MCTQWISHMQVLRGGRRNRFLHHMQIQCTAKQNIQTLRLCPENFYIWLKIQIFPNTGSITNLQLQCIHRNITFPCLESINQRDQGCHIVTKYFKIVTFSLLENICLIFKIRINIIILKIINCLC